MDSIPMISFTFIRHGESTDNLRSLWAGWSDSPLSNHGMNQARAVGASFSSTHFSAIYTSDLLRAYTTAESLRDAQPASDSPPSFTVSPLLREQHFGVAEGGAWTWSPDPALSAEEHYAKGVYPALTERHEKFPEGESADDLARRADRVLDELLMPEVWKAARSGERGVMVAVVSHGLCITEMMSAFMRRDGGSGNNMGGRYRGLMNTGWHRICIDVQGASKSEPLVFPDNDTPPLIIRVTHINHREHLDNVKRQKGGIGSLAHDPKQQDIRAFFGGAGIPTEGASKM